MKGTNQILAYNLKKWRLARGLTQEALAELTNLNFRTIGRLENATHFCKAETIDLLVTALNIKTEDLFKEPEHNIGKIRKDKLFDIIRLIESFPSSRLDEIYKTLCNLMS